MPPMSDAEKQKLLLQQEIAKLSGAITRHATQPASNSYHPYRPARGSYRGRGARGGRRGRGGYSLDLRNNAHSSSSTAASTAKGSPAPPETPLGDKEAGEVDEQPEAPGSSLQPSLASSLKGKEPAQDWVKGMSKSGNMSLMTVQKIEQLKLLPPKSRTRRTRGVPANVQVLNSVAGPDETQRVVIDGVIFQFEPGGSKLTRIGEMSPSGGPSSSTPTRKKLAFGGKQYRRTSKGNLISGLSRAEAAKKPCRYFTKTGRCNRALTCPYLHDSSRLAICPKFLRGTCEHLDSSCPLSHTPSPHNTPSCVHFQATSTCRNGPTCPYPHVRVSPDAAVCDAFARDGWCDAAEGTCPQLHVWECGEWRSTGKCSRGAKCGLRHVIRAEKGKAKASRAEAERDGLQADTVVPGGAADDRMPVEVDPLAFEHNTEFIGFGADGEQGLPGAISETEDDEHADGGGEEGDGQDSSESDSDASDDESEDAPGNTRLALPGEHLEAASDHASEDDAPMDADEDDEDEDSEDEVLGVVS